MIESLIKIPKRKLKSLGLHEKYKLRGTRYYLASRIEYNYHSLNGYAEDKVWYWFKFTGSSYLKCSGSEIIDLHNCPTDILFNLDILHNPRDPGE